MIPIELELLSAVHYLRSLVARKDGDPNTQTAGGGPKSKDAMDPKSGLGRPIGHADKKREENCFLALG